MRPGKIQIVVACLLLPLAFAGCSEEGNTFVNEMIPEPEPVVISGEWDTDTTETLDTCGFDPFPSYAPLLVEESGDSVVFTFNDGFGNCQESVRQRAGDTVTLTKTDTLDGGCGLVRVQSNYVYEFTEMTLSGTATHQYSVIEGACSNLPCTYQLAVGGGRCQNCWPGCNTITHEQPEPLPGAAAEPGPSAVGTR